LKKLSALLLGFAGMFVLSGCSAQDRSGTFYETFVKPMDISLSKIHDYVGSWGWSIVIITLIIRIIILPFMLLITHRIVLYRLVYLTHGNSESMIKTCSYSLVGKY